MNDYIDIHEINNFQKTVGILNGKEYLSTCNESAKANKWKNGGTRMKDQNFRDSKETGRSVEKIRRSTIEVKCSRSRTKQVEKSARSVHDENDSYNTKTFENNNFIYRK